MARYGVAHLLTKYNNPISYSVRILINSKSYYHPYKMLYYDNMCEGTKNYILCNKTTIGNINLELTRGLCGLIFRYRSESCIITFSRQAVVTYIGIISHRNKRNYNTWIEKYSNTDKFVVRGFDPNFLRVADKITETTLSEIYKNHLPTILSILEI